MLGKTLFIAINTLRPNTFKECADLRGLLDVSVMFVIYKSLVDRFYRHLPIAYNYQFYANHNYLNMTDSLFESEPVKDKELRLFKQTIEKFIENAIEEFHMTQPLERGTVLNFNGVLMNSHNYVLSVEVLNWSQLS